MRRITGSRNERGPNPLRASLISGVKDDWDNLLCGQFNVLQLGQSAAKLQFFPADIELAAHIHARQSRLGKGITIVVPAKDQFRFDVVKTGRPTATPGYVNYRKKPQVPSDQGQLVRFRRTTIPPPHQPHRVVKVNPPLSWSAVTLGNEAATS